MTKNTMQAQYRIERGVAFLETLALMRALCVNNGFGREQEGQIIQREVIDLEMQNVDEEIDSICERSGGYTRP